MQDGGYGGFSTGSYSSAGNFSSAGGYAGGYSTGGFTGGYGGSWTSCEEMYCYGTAYLDNGEVDWDATYAANVTCSTYDKGCPCNEKWELACESYGMKAGHTRCVGTEKGDSLSTAHGRQMFVTRQVCISKSEGCYDPFDVTCTWAKIMANPTNINRSTPWNYVWCKQSRVTGQLHFTKCAHSPRS